MSRRAWTEAQARAWLKASLPKGWDVGIACSVYAAYVHAGVEVGLSTYIPDYPTLRAACLALVRAAKRAGINVTAAPEPQQGGK